MKKILLTLASIFLSLSLVSAQDLAKATEIYNNGATALSLGKKADALKCFQDALKMGETLGDSGKELVSNCKNAIPGIVLSIGKDLCKAKKVDEGIAKVKEAIELAKKYGVDSIVKEGETLLPQISLQNDINQADALLKIKKFDEASKIYKSVLDKDSTNSVATLRLIQCLAYSGDLKTAASYLDLAKKNGQGSNASKIIGTVYLKNAVSDLKLGKFQESYDKALESVKYTKNSQAYFIGGQAAQKMNKNAEAVKCFEEYLNLSPKAGNAGQIALTIGALYQGMSNKAKAIEYYKKAKELGVDTQQYIDALMK